ncbi:hypothetical protein DH2020_041926 [Rehmannia glutinosa]|uniref:Protein kinase domain-containing protein n=1 Tax=Rehmannia glutinosa TaxID=99300 RepID=A0ABR0UPF7_REHGL
MKKHRNNQLLLCLFTTILSIQLTSAVDFLFNGFGSSDVSRYGDAGIESRILTLANETPYSIALSFIFTMAPYQGRLPGLGIVFLFVPYEGIQGYSPPEYLGLFNRSSNGDPNNHVFGVEFDVFENEEFDDINDNHVGIDLNSLVYVRAYKAGYWPNDFRRKEDGSADERSFQRLTFNNGRNYQVWIDYVDGTVNVTMAPVEIKRPNQPLLSAGGKSRRADGGEVSRVGSQPPFFISVLLNLSQVFEDRNLVGLRGWCKKEKGNLILVYDYMENGNLEKRVFECDEIKMLDFEDRVRILKQVDFGVMYLHYGWESKVLHRDIKASNVLFDKEMNAKLGDFGLARIHDHDKVDNTTRMVGTVGLRAKGEIDEEKVESVLHLGLLCAHPDPKFRPTMRQVVKLFEGKTQVDESIGENVEMHMLEKMKTKEILCTSTSISWSNSIGMDR